MVLRSIFVDESHVFETENTSSDPPTAPCPCAPCARGSLGPCNSSDRKWGQRDSTSWVGNGRNGAKTCRKMVVLNFEPAENGH